MADTMRAVVFSGGRPSLQRLPVPEPGAGEALLRVTLAGVCRTDQELLRGYHDFEGVPGHEFVAEVERAPDRPELEGMRVTADINLGCGRCSRCAAGDPRHCPDRAVIGILGAPGAFAEFLLAPIANLRPIPRTLTGEEAVFAEPLAAAMEPANQISLTPETRLLVLGDGKLGVLAALALRERVPGLLLAGRHQEKLALAADQGVRTLLVGDAPPGCDRLGGLMDVVIECTGRPQGLEWAMGLVRPEGTIVLKTTIAEPVPLDTATAVVNELTLVGSRCGDLGAALDVLARGAVDPLPLIEAVYPLDDFPKALAHADRPGAAKILISF